MSPSAFEMDLPSKPTKCNICEAQEGVKACPCFKVGYCSTEHQKEDRGSHVKDCYPVIIQSSQDFGKYLVATRDFKAGQHILKEVPLLVGPTSSFSEYGFPICLACCSAVNNGFKCSKCGWGVCNLKCEKAEIHASNECSIFQEHQIQYTNKGESYNFVQVLRALLLKDKDPEKWKTLLGFEAHVEERKKRDLFVEGAQKDWEFIHDKCQLKQFDFDTVNFVSGALAMNSFEPRCVSHQYTVPQGIRFESRLYPFASKLFHDCISNVKIIVDYKAKKRNRQEVVLMATTPISRGEKLTQFYGNAEVGTRERQANQLANYFFSCKCDRCKDPTELGTFVSGVKCSCGNGYYLPREPLDQESIWECQSCGATESFDPFISGKVEEIKADADVLMTNIVGIGDDIKNYALASRVILKVESILNKYSGVTVHPNHYALLPIKFNLLHALFNANNPELPTEMRLELCRKTEDAINEYMPVYDALFPGLTPERGKIMFYRTITALNVLNLAGINYMNRESCQKLLEMFETNKELLYGQPEESEEALMYAQLDKTERLLLDEMGGLE